MSQNIRENHKEKKKETLLNLPPVQAWPGHAYMFAYSTCLSTLVRAACS